MFNEFWPFLICQVWNTEDVKLLPCAVESGRPELHPVVYKRLLPGGSWAYSAPRGGSRETPPLQVTDTGPLLSVTALYTVAWRASKSSELQMSLASCMSGPNLLDRGWRILYRPPCRWWLHTRNGRSPPGWHFGWSPRHRLVPPAPKTHGLCTIQTHAAA